MDRFEFRCIRPEETPQAIEIEQICFPPNEGSLEMLNIAMVNNNSDVVLTQVQ